jgi:signal transduction histidine kinase
MVEPPVGQRPKHEPSGEQEVVAAMGLLGILNQEADAVRAELRVLREDLARVKQEIGATASAQLLQANEQLVLAALRAQAIADSARRRLRDLTGAGPKPPHLAVSGQLARAEYHTRVADLREANEQLVLAALSSREVEADAEQAHSRQIAFLAMAAHELRNPLLPLRLATKLITRGRTEEQLVKLQETIDGQVNHMARLIGDLLDGSRISTGKFRLERRIVDLSGILDNVIEACQGVMDVGRHRFERLGPSGPLSVNGDAMRLVQVFSNLLENAAKYTPEGGRISLGTVVEGDRVAITVADNGIGITAQALPHVFELERRPKRSAGRGLRRSRSCRHPVLR